MKRTLERLVIKFGNPIFEIKPDQDKYMCNEEIHDIVDIPEKVIVFLRPENPEFCKQYHKYIAFSKYKNDDYYYYQDANEMLVKYFLDKTLK